jgi:hypothetical protein
MLPAPSGKATLAEGEFLDFLRSQSDNSGTLPPWHRWWSDDVLCEMLPDEQLRHDVTNDIPQLSLDYFTKPFDIPSGWLDRPCSYLLFSEGYRSAAQSAIALGWPTSEVLGGHLHLVIAASDVAKALVELAVAEEEPNRNP